MTTTRVCWLSQHAKDRHKKRGHSCVVSASFFLFLFLFFLRLFALCSATSHFRNSLRSKRQPAVLIISPIGTSCYPNSCKLRHIFTVGYFILSRRSARARARACVYVAISKEAVALNQVPADKRRQSFTAADPPADRTHPHRANRKANTARICNKWVLLHLRISKCASVPLTDWRLSVHICVFQNAPLCHWLTDFVSSARSEATGLYWLGPGSTIQVPVNQLHGRNWVTFPQQVRSKFS